MLSFLASLFRPKSKRDGVETPTAPRASANRQMLPESRFRIEVTADAIINHRPEGKTETVRFADLAAVIIETNDTGPWGSDVWWILLGKDRQSGCVYPGGATGEGEALSALQRLPGFDNEAVIRAMGSCDNARFLCWKAGGNQQAPNSLS